jgi:quercetin dioxygenase-like cupin family protein
MNTRLFRLLLLSLLPFLGLYAVRADKDDDPKHADDKNHVIVTPDKIKWGPAPRALPSGAQLAVLSGDPRKAGAYTMRVKLPDGYKVPPHWHPVDENVTVIKGTFNVGRGEKFDADATKKLPAGSYVHMPKTMRHFAWAKGETIIQVHGIGPFEINYVNAEDDPRKKKE